MKRRMFIVSGAAAALVTSARANTAPVIQVMKSPTCGCCTAWVDYMRQSGFVVEAQDVDQDTLYGFKANLQITPDLAGCHTAIVGNYFIEGHVPAEDIQRLLEMNPAARGLAVPGMPMSSPGMGGPGAGDAFDTLLVGPDGATSVFASHT